MALYNLRTSDGEYRITKFTADLEVESSYITSLDTCECPAGVRPTCRHRQMLPKMLAQGIEDSPCFYDFERDVFLEPQVSDQTFDDDELEILAADDENEIASEALPAQPSPTKPHSTTVSASDFDSEDGGSNPPAAAKPSPPHPALEGQTLRRRI